MLKHMPKDALKTLEKHLLYSKKKVKFYGNDNGMCAHHTTTNATHANKTDLRERVEKFQDQIKSEFVYRIPLKFLCDLGLVSQYFKFNTKYILTLETDMQRLFETNVNQAADALPRTIKAEIILTSAPYIMYKQLKLDDNYQTYFEGILISERVLRSRIKPTPYKNFLNLSPALSLEL